MCGKKLSACDERSVSELTPLDHSKETPLDKMLPLITSNVASSGN